MKEIAQLPGTSEGLERFTRILHLMLGFSIGLTIILVSFALLYAYERACEHDMYL